MDIQNIDLRRKDFEASHPAAKTFIFNEETMLYSGLKVEILNGQWTTWCACIGMMHFESLEVQVPPEGFVLVPKQQRKGGYYLWDIRSPIGNCMKFLYTNGYGTKLEKFHWFPTLEDALSSKGGAGWFKPWYAPYIDSIAEKTIDFQLADRSKEKAMIEAVEGK